MINTATEVGSCTALLITRKDFGQRMSKNTNDEGIRQNLLSISELIYTGGCMTFGDLHPLLC